MDSAEALPPALFPTLRTLIVDLNYCFSFFTLSVLPPQDSLDYCFPCSPNALHVFPLPFTLRCSCLFVLWFSFVEKWTNVFPFTFSLWKSRKKVGTSTLPCYQLSIYLFSPTLRVRELEDTQISNTGYYIDWSYFHAKIYSLEICMVSKICTSDGVYLVFWRLDWYKEINAFKHHQLWNHFW